MFVVTNTTAKELIIIYTRSIHNCLLLQTLSNYPHHHHHHQYPHALFYQVQVQARLLEKRVPFTSRLDLVSPVQVRAALSSAHRRAMIFGEVPRVSRAHARTSPRFL